MEIDKRRAAVFVLIVTGLVLTWAGIAWAIVALAAHTKARRTYATCYQGDGITSSGTATNKRTAASNTIAAGTKVQLVGAQTGPGGIRRYVVRDTGSHLLDDGHLDLFSPGGGCETFGHRAIGYRIGWSR